MWCDNLPRLRGKLSQVTFPYKVVINNYCVTTEENSILFNCSQGFHSKLWHITAFLNIESKKYKNLETKCVTTSPGLSYVLKDIALKLNVKSRKYTRYSQWQYGDSGIKIDFECWFFPEKILNTLIHNYYDSFKSASVIVCGKSVTRFQNKLLRACEIRSQCVSFALLRSLKLSLSHSIVFYMLLRTSLVLPVFVVHPTAKIWRDFSTFIPSLIFRELWLPFTKLYIFDKLKNVQNIVDRRNCTRVNNFQTTWPWKRRRRHRSRASGIRKIAFICTEKTKKYWRLWREKFVSRQ